MKKISLISKSKRIDGDFKGSGILFLVWGKEEYKLVLHPKDEDHCVAVFCKQNNSIVAIKLHSSIGFAKDANARYKWLKDQETIGLGIEPFMVRYKENRRIGIIPKFASGAILLAGLFTIFSMAISGKSSVAKKPLETRSEVPIQQLQVKEEWQIARLISDAKMFIAKKDTAQAKMSLEQALNLSPTNAEAKKLLEELNAPTQATGPTEEERAFAEKSERGELLVQQAESALLGGEAGKAYKLFNEATALFKEGDVKPAWWKRGEDGTSSARSRLEERFGPSVTKAEGLISQEKTEASKEAVELLREALLSYPDYKKADDVLALAYRSLNNIGMQFVMKGETLRRLSGCKQAVEQFRTAMSASAYPEVPAYQRAQVGLGECS